MLEQLPPGQLAWDTEMRGFGARKAQSGAVSFFLNYQQRETGKYRRVVIAKLGECTADAARKRAAELRLEIRAGVGPSQQVETPAKRRISGDTLGQHVEAWLHDSRHKWSGTTRTGYLNAMRRDLLESNTAASRIGDVTRRDLMALIDLATERSQSSGALFFRTLGSFLSLADARGLTEVTLPKAGRAAPVPDARTRVMTDVELRALWRTADELRSLTAFSGKVMLLTAQRSGAVQRLERDWVTQAGITWPASVMKSSSDHWTPLTPWALEQGRPILAKTSHVFAATLPGSAKHGPRGAPLLVLILI